MAGASLAYAAKKALDKSPGPGPDRTAEYHDCPLRLLGSAGDVFDLFDATLGDTKFQRAGKASGDFYLQFGVLKTFNALGEHLRTCLVRGPRDLPAGKTCDVAGWQHNIYMYTASPEYGYHGLGLC